MLQNDVRATVGIARAVRHQTQRELIGFVTSDYQK